MSIQVKALNCENTLSLILNKSSYCPQCIVFFFKFWEQILFHSSLMNQGYKLFCGINDSALTISGERDPPLYILNLLLSVFCNTFLENILFSFSTLSSNLILHLQMKQKMQKLHGWQRCSSIPVSASLFLVSNFLQFYRCHQTKIQSKFLFFFEIFVCLFVNLSVNLCYITSYFFK